jgi:hypothetical protein
MIPTAPRACLDADDCLPPGTPVTPLSCPSAPHPPTPLLPACPLVLRCRTGGALSENHRRDVLEHSPSPTGFVEQQNGPIIGPLLPCAPLSPNTWLPDRPYSMLKVAQCLVVCRSLKRMDTSTRRPRQGAPLCTRCMRRRCGDTPMLSRVLCATQYDKWSETRQAFSGGSDRPPASLLPRQPR